MNEQTKDTKEDTKTIGIIKILIGIVISVCMCALLFVLKKYNVEFSAPELFVSFSPIFIMFFIALLYPFLKDSKIIELTLGKVFSAKFETEKGIEKIREISKEEQDKINKATLQNINELNELITDLLEYLGYTINYSYLESHPQYLDKFLVFINKYKIRYDIKQIVRLLSVNVIDHFNNVCKIYDKRFTILIRDIVGICIGGSFIKYYDKDLILKTILEKLKDGNGQLRLMRRLGDPCGDLMSEDFYTQEDAEMAAKIIYDELQKFKFPIEFLEQHKDQL